MGLTAVKWMVCVKCDMYVLAVNPEMYISLKVQVNTWCWLEYIYTVGVLTYVRQSNFKLSKKLSFSG